MVAAGIALLMTACAANNIKGFDRVVSDAETHAASYSEADWKRADERFEDFVEKYNADYLRTLGADEQQEVGRLVARYAKVRLEYANRQMQELLKAGSNMASGFIDEMGSDTSLLQGLTDVEELPGELEEFYEDMEELMEEYGGLLDE